MTFTVRGFKVRSQSRRRYVVCRVQPQDVFFTSSFDGKPITVKACAEIIKRSDSLATAQRYSRNYGLRHGSFSVVVDTVTGEEI